MATPKWKEDNQELMRKYRRDWYERNKRQGMEAVAKRKQEIREWYRDYKKTCFCKTCGEMHPACLTFHHRDASEKLVEVSTMIQNGYNRGRILAEIDKCDVICANCHAKVHWGLLFD